MSPETRFIDRILQNRVLSHSLFWAGFFFLFTLVTTLNSGHPSTQLIHNFALLPAQLMGTYTLVYYQVPKLLLQKKYLLFTFTFFLFAYFFALIARISMVHLAEPFTRENFQQETILEIIQDPFYLFVVYFPTVYMMAFLLLALKSIKARFEEKHQLEELRKEKATSELQFLKAQIHPHFLFNTLNNLYALTLAKSDAAPKVVVKLSEMLDYMLYQCNDDRIAIDKEIELIQNYIDLEQLRYGDRVHVNFQHKVVNPATQIAPLVLLSLIENAFKHGVKGDFKTPFIQIVLTVMEERLEMHVYNSKPLVTSPSELDHHGIGMSNVKRQLSLNYPEHHELTVVDEPTSYHVSLIIDLKTAS